MMFLPVLIIKSCYHMDFHSLKRFFKPVFHKLSTIYFTFIFVAVNYILIDFIPGLSLYLNKCSVDDGIREACSKLQFCIVYKIPLILFYCKN